MPMGVPSVMYVCGANYARPAFTKLTGFPLTCDILIGTAPSRQVQIFWYDG